MCFTNWVYWIGHTDLSNAGKDPLLITHMLMSMLGGAVTNRFCLCFNLMSIIYRSMWFYDSYTSFTTSKWFCVLISPTPVSHVLITYFLFIVYMCTQHCLYFHFYLSYTSHLWLMLSVLNTTMNKAYSISSYSKMEAIYPCISVLPIVMWMHSSHSSLGINNGWKLDAMGIGLENITTNIRNYVFGIWQKIVLIFD